MKYRPKGFLLLLIKVVLYAKVSIVCFFLIRLMLAFVLFGGYEFN